MLHFLRTHQRIFFLILTIVIVISFAFFGTYNAFVDPPKGEEDVVIHTTVDGQEINGERFSCMKRFLSSNAETFPSSSAFPNFLNPGFIENTIIQTGIVEELAYSHFDKMSEQLAREKAWTPYVHSESDLMAATNIWKVFCPTILESLENLKKDSPKDQIKAHFTLYMAERRFPAPYLAQMLQWNQDKQPLLSHEVEALKDHFSLFGYKDIVDWMSPELYDTLIKTIFDAAAKAKKSALAVSDEEALEWIKASSEKGREKAKALRFQFMNLNSPSGFLKQLYSVLQMSESQVIDVCKTLLLVEKYSQEAGSHVFVDGLTLDLVHEATKNKQFASLYGLSKDFQWTEGKDLYEFETWLELVSAKKSLTDLPKTKLSANDVKKRAPQLVEQTFSLEMSSMSRKEALSKLPFKQLLAWQISDAGFQQLRQRFKELKEGQNADERLAALDFLTISEREEVDSYSRETLFKASKGTITALLEKAPTKKIDVKLACRGGSSAVFEELPSTDRLYDTLAESASSMKEEAPFDLGMLTFDNEHFYRIKLLKKPAEPVVLSYREAKDKGILAKLVSKSAKEKYKHLVSQILKEAKEMGLSWKAQTASEDIAASLRFLSFVKQEKERLQSSTLAKETEKAREVFGNLDEPWSLKKESLILEKAGGTPGLLALKEGRFPFFVLPDSKGIVTSEREALERRAFALAEEEARQEALRELFDDLIHRNS